MHRIILSGWLAAGVLLSDAIPVYPVRAFAARAITLASDARPHTPADASIRETWFGIATIADVFALASLFAGVMIK